MNLVGYPRSSWLWKKPYVFGSYCTGHEWSLLTCVSPLRNIHGITLVRYDTPHDTPHVFFLFMKWLKCGLSLRYEYKYNMDTFLCQIFIKLYKNIYHNFDFKQKHSHSGGLTINHSHTQLQHHFLHLKPLQAVSLCQILLPPYITATHKTLYIVW
jgi:hypothetical protein